MSDKYPKGNNDTYNVLPGTSDRESFGSRAMKDFRAKFASGGVVNPDRYLVGERPTPFLQPLDRMAQTDFSDIETRVSAHMGIPPDRLGRRDLADAEQEHAWEQVGVVMDQIMKSILFDCFHSLGGVFGLEDAQQNIDEEGCGAFFAAAREVVYG